MIKTLCRIPLSLYIFFIGIAVHSISEGVIASDMGWYMNAALNLYSGNGYVDIQWEPIYERPPGFSLMLAVSYWFLGASVASAFWVVRVFCVLNPIAIYFLGKRLFGKWIGFSAALFILSSYSMNYWSFRHIDAVWPFFCVMAVLTIFNCFEKNGCFWWVVSGCLLGLSYMIKESAILFFPLPFLMVIFVKEYRKKYIISGLFVYIASISIVCLPWIIYAYFKTNDIGLSVFGYASLPEVNRIFTTSIAQSISKALFGLVSFYNSGTNALSNNFFLAPVFILSWCYLIFLSVKRDKNSIIIFSCLILLLPYISVSGTRNLRLGQLILVYLLTYLITSKFLFDSVHWYISKTYITKTKNITVISLVALIVVFQTFIPYGKDSGNIDYLKKSWAYKAIKKNSYDYNFLIKGGAADRECGEWIKKNITRGSRLLFSKYSQGKDIYFYSGGKYPMHIMPVVSIYNRNETQQEIKKENIIFLSSWVQRDDPQNKIFILMENDLLEYIKKKKIKYVVINRKRNYLSIYFEENRGFERIMEFGGGSIKIYKVIDPQKMTSFKPLVSNQISNYLYALKQKNREKYLFYFEKIFKPLLGWGVNDMDRLLPDVIEKQSDLRHVLNNSVYMPGEIAGK